MSGGRLLLGALSISVAMLGTAAAQLRDLPAGPNRDLVSRACQACHDLAMVVAATGLTREGWNATIDEMISYGMRVDAEDRAKILDYLSNNLGSR
jgi:cytochrome c5